MFSAIFDYLTLDHAGAAAVGGVGVVFAKYGWEAASYVAGRGKVFFKAMDAFAQAAEAQAASAQALAASHAAAASTATPAAK